MKEIISLKKEILLWAILIAPVAYLFIVWNQIPAEVPIHWNMDGEVDNYGPKWILPLFNIALYLLLLVLPFIDPRKKNYEFFKNSFYRIRLFLTLFFTIITLAIIAFSSGLNINIEKIVVMGIMGLFAMLGNYMTTVRPNWFIGIRTPWTMENDEVWKRTHKVGGKLWFWSGLIGLIAALFISGKVLFIFFGILTALITIIPVIHSYVLFKKLKKE